MLRARWSGWSDAVAVELVGGANCLEPAHEFEMYESVSRPAKPSDWSRSRSYGVMRVSSSAFSIASSLVLLRPSAEEALESHAWSITDFLRRRTRTSPWRRVQLRREVESLLEHDGGAAFLSTPAVANVIVGALRIGQALGPYVISAQIGAGGMGEVYRARDTKLGRDVAIKILPRRLHGRSRSARAVRARGAGARVAQSSAHRRDLRRRGSGRRPRRWCWSWSRARRWPRRLAAQAPEAGLPIHEALDDRAADRRRARRRARARASSTAI